LLTKEIKPSTQIQTLNDFQKHFVETGIIPFEGNFKDFVLRINKNEPTEAFAIEYWNDARKFMEDVFAFRSVAEKETAIAK
jgi:sulfite reductase (ferredoxin)